MKKLTQRVMWIAALAMWGMPVMAQETAPLKLAAKLALPTVKVAPWRSSELPAPFEPAPVPLIPPPQLRIEVLPGSCELSGRALCYNYLTGGSVYRPSRELMPDIRGMRRESLSVKRDKVTFNYSFK